MQTNCLLEIFFDSAIEDAKKLDAYFAEHNKPIGQLHGLPVSLKDQFHVKGVETTMGYTGWIGTFQGVKDTGKERVFESVMVEELKSMGALLYCKTSVPHTLMAGETINNIAGYCYNPKNRNLTAGGSSGGEGALIGARGSPLGFGTDIGGSIRIPAAFNGLFGLRPSTGRLPYEGMANSMDGQNTILSAVGPLSSSIAGIQLVTKAILSQKPWLHDPLVHDIPWREEQYQSVASAAKDKGRLTFAVLRHDGACQPVPPVSRAVDMVVKSLEQRGHQVIEWTPPSHRKGEEIAGAVWEYDSGADVMKDFGLSGEDIAPQTLIFREDHAQYNASKIAAVNIAKRQFQKEYMEYWNSTAKQTGTGEPVDAIICPAAPFPAARPNKYTHYAYTMIWNVLDYTVSTLPVTTVDKSVDVVNTAFQPLGKVDQETQDTYDPEIYDGAHVSVQIVGRRLQEEKIIALTEYVSKGLTGGKNGAKL